ncbi:hypothetical protein QO002_003062 [Pararhizobium capsulatum DSM 1112]|uniref:Uncharacterized protein n=1 Tax=Pararhizobium capsulatum DSM 1112 TaxID=1121113 RepID=A0ABU0BRR2_9HYPH|nr:hypothetical protein [Pararhizobium capsulatum DSM 1112]
MMSVWWQVPAEAPPTEENIHEACYLEGFDS